MEQTKEPGCTAQRPEPVISGTFLFWRLEGRRVRLLREKTQGGGVAQDKDEFRLWSVGFEVLTCSGTEEGV